MTRAIFHPDPFFPTIKVNRRTISCRRITEFRQVRKGLFEGLASDLPFTIEGGKAAGGSARDWFLDWDDQLKGFHCPSLKAAIEAIETC